MTMPKSERFKLDFSARLQEQRALKGWTQRDLGKKCRIHHVQIAHYESGVTRPGLENLVNLCKALGCTADYLLGIE